MVKTTTVRNLFVIFWGSFGSGLQNFFATFSCNSFPKIPTSMRAIKTICHRWTVTETHVDWKTFEIRSETHNKSIFTKQFSKHSSLHNRAFPWPRGIYSCRNPLVFLLRRSVINNYTCALFVFNRRFPLSTTIKVKVPAKHTVLKILRYS